MITTAQCSGNKDKRMESREAFEMAIDPTTIHHKVGSFFPKVGHLARMQ